MCSRGYLPVGDVCVGCNRLVISRVWPGSDEEGNRADGTGTNQTLVVKKNKSRYVMQISKFESSMNLNEWLKDFGLFLQVNEIYGNQNNVLLSLFSSECLRIVRNMVAPSQVDFACDEIIRILRNVWVINRLG